MAPRDDDSRGYSRRHSRRHICRHSIRSSEGTKWRESALLRCPHCSIMEGQKWQQTHTHTHKSMLTNEILNGTASLSGRLISCLPWAHPKDALIWYTTWLSPPVVTESGLKMMFVKHLSFVVVVRTTQTLPISRASFRLLGN